MKTTNKLLSLSKEGNYFLIKTEGSDIRLYFLTEDIFRLRADFSGEFKEASYILTKTAWEDQLDEVLGEERERITCADVKVDERDDKYILSTSKISVELGKGTFSLVVKDSEGTKIHADLSGRSIQQDHLGRVYHYTELNNDNFYGFGESTGTFNKRYNRISLSPKDAIGHNHSPQTTNLYKHIPFYVKLDGETGYASGLFYHNTFESEFFMGCERSGYWKEYNYFRADGGDIDYFFINGPSLKDVIERYTYLTGRPILTPKYSLGYIASTMYYAELDQDCDEGHFSFLEQGLEEGIPTSSFQLASGYTAAEDRRRFVFTWNNKRFPNPKRFFEVLNEKGCPAFPNTKPGILLDHPLYKDFEAVNGFIMDANGEKPYVDNWWGGLGSFVDFTNPKARALWKKHAKEQLIDNGALMIWNDNCEYEINDRMAQCSFEGMGGVAADLKAVQPTVMAKAVQDVLIENRPSVRPFVLSRSGSAGIQRYAQTWAGDNKSRWEDIYYGFQCILGMGMSGAGNHGVDIGGFTKEKPEQELLMRWAQAGIFYPRFCVNSASTDNTVTELWMYNDVTPQIRHALQIRLSLIPYIYSMFYKHSQTGEPVLRPLMLDFQSDPKTYDVSDQAMFGDSILVAPIMEKGVTKRSIYLPAGCCWYDWYTNERYEGGQTITINVDKDTIPMYLKEGGLVTWTTDIQNPMKDKAKVLNISLAPKTSEHVYYDDDGLTNDYKDGLYYKLNINVVYNSICEIDINPEGNYSTNIESFEWKVINVEKGAYWCTLDNKAIPQFMNRKQFDKAEFGWLYENSNSTVRIKYPNNNKSHSLKVSFEKFDLVGCGDD